VADSERGAMGAIGREVESAQNQPMVGFVLLAEEPVEVSVNDVRKMR
jgi:hypothetical protein